MTSISVDHSNSNPPLPTKCILCLDSLDAPYLIIHIGTWNIHAHDECWDQLEEMVATIRNAHNKAEGDLVH